VFDATGTAIGSLVHNDPDHGVHVDYIVYLSAIGARAIVNSDTGDLSENIQNAIFFESDDCTGTPYTPPYRAGFAASATIGAKRLFVGRTKVPRATIFPESSLSVGDSCIDLAPQGGGTNLIPADEIDRSQLGLPVPGPLYVAP
jgi:hypothetical protein